MRILQGERRRNVGRKDLAVAGVISLRAIVRQDKIGKMRVRIAEAVLNVSARQQQCRKLRFYPFTLQRAGIFSDSNGCGQYQRRHLQVTYTNVERRDIQPEAIIKTLILYARLKVVA